MALLGQLFGDADYWIICSDPIGMQMGSGYSHIQGSSLFPAISDNRIHTLATVLDFDNSSYSIYLDGTMFASKHVPVAQMGIDGPWLVIGNAAWDGWNLNALFHKVQLWDLALTPREVYFAVRGDFIEQPFEISKPGILHIQPMGIKNLSACST
jgi:hypothetical protein